MEDIRYIIKCIKWYAKNRFIINENYEVLFKELCGLIVEVLYEWTGKTYVGIRKNEEFIMVYQTFFIELCKLIGVLSSNENSLMELEKEFIISVKYKGKIYRYLGHGDLKNLENYIEPIYDGIYVSWSKEKENTYLESKLYGKTTRLYGIISEDSYGIDIEKFQEFYNKYFNENVYIAKAQEREVVYPTIKKAIYNIEYISNK